MAKTTVADRPAAGRKTSGRVGGARPQLRRPMAPAAKNANTRPPAVKWEHGQLMLFSAMVLAYKQRCGELPASSDKIFWTFRSYRLHQRFTVRQVLDKLRRMKQRHHQISSGNAKTIKPLETQTYALWTQILLQQPPQTNITAPPPAPPAHEAAAQVITKNGDVDKAQNDQAGGGAQYEEAEMPTNKSASGARPCMAQSSPADHDHEIDNSMKYAEAANGSAGDDDEAAQGAVEEEEQGGVSTCSTNYVNMQYGQGQRHSHEMNDHGEGAAEDDAEESGAHKTLLRHIIVADLASATKTVAESNKALAETTMKLADILTSYGAAPPAMF